MVCCAALQCAALRCDVLGGSVDGELWRELAVENQADVNNASAHVTSNLPSLA